MHTTPRRRFEPSSPRLRRVFAVAAALATLATAHLIDVLAQGHGTRAPLVVQHAPAVVAHVAISAPTHY